MTTREDCEGRIGTRLKGKWTLEKLLGVGGMAAVYVGVHHIGRRDAIKILHPEFVRDPEIRARFELEGLATNRFRHPGAVEVKDSDVSEDGCPFLVMDLLDGETLGDRARRLGDIPASDALRWAAEILEVLDAAHREGIVHRDIKLENIFITADGRARLLDFGVARVGSSAMRTQLGARLGTTSYMAPEQVRGGEVDGRVDLFALGVVLFRLLTKRKIHEAPSENELVVKMATEPAPKTRTVNPAISEDLALVIDRALAFDARDRYPDARAMLSDVAAIRADDRPAFALARSAAPAMATARTIGPGSAMGTAVTMGVGTPTAVVAPGDATRVAPASYGAHAAVSSSPTSVSNPSSYAAAPPFSAAGPAGPGSGAPSAEVPSAAPASASAAAPAPAAKPQRNTLMVPALIVSAVLVAIMIVVVAVVAGGDGDAKAATSSASASASGAVDAPTTSTSAAGKPPPLKSSSDADDFLRRVRDIENAKKKKK